MTQQELADVCGVSKVAISKNKNLPKTIDSYGHIFYDPLNAQIQAYITRATRQRRTSLAAKPISEPEPQPEPTEEETAQKAADRIAGVFRDRPKPERTRTIIKQPRQAQFTFPSEGLQAARDSAEQLNNIDARKNKAMAENYELKNEILRGDYIERALLHRFLGKLFAIDQSEWKTMPDRASPELTAAARSADTDDLAQVAISEILKREAHATLRHVQEIIKKFLFDIESLESIDELAAQESGAPAESNGHRELSEARK